MRSLKLKESALVKLKNTLSRNEKSARKKWKIRSVKMENRSLKLVKSAQ
jgi:hypothetical protein